MNHDDDALTFIQIWTLAHTLSRREGYIDSRPRIRRIRQPRSSTDLVEIASSAFARRS